MIIVHAFATAKYSDPYSYHIWDKNLAHWMSGASRLHITKHDASECGLEAVLRLDLESSVDDEGVAEEVEAVLEEALSPPYMEGINLELIRDEVNIRSINRLPAVLSEAIGALESALDEHEDFMTEDEATEGVYLVDRLRELLKDVSA